MLLHRSADGLSSLTIKALGLWQITPSLLQVCLATPVDVTSEAGGLARLLRDAARFLPKPLPRRHRNLVQSFGLAFGCHTFRSRCGPSRRVTGGEAVVDRIIHVPLLDRLRFTLGMRWALLVDLLVRHWD